MAASNDQQAGKAVTDVSTAGTAGTSTIILQGRYVNYNTTVDGSFVEIDPSDSTTMSCSPDVLTLVCEALNATGTQTTSITTTPSQPSIISSEAKSTCTADESTDNCPWSTASILHLLTLIRDSNERLGDRSMLKRKIWERIGVKMRDSGYQVTWQQCDRKWRYLKQRYFFVKQNNSKSERSKKVWEYFELMDNIMQSKPDLSQSFASSTPPPQLTDDMVIESVQTAHASSPTKRKIDAESKAAMTAEQKRRQTRHEEKMVRQDRFLNLFEKMIKKL